MNYKAPTTLIATTLIIVLLVVSYVYSSTSLVFGQQSQNSTKPVDGYNKPDGHLNAIRHVFDDPGLRVEHFCKPDNKIVITCQLYDSASQNGTLIGVEYIITADQFKTLPDREKPYWHHHKVEFATNRADPKFPELSTQQTGEQMKKLMDTYGKVIITWNPRDTLPVFPPQVELVDHPFMINSTVKPEAQVGSFNQTLKY